MVFVGEDENSVPKPDSTCVALTKLINLSFSPCKMSRHYTQNLFNAAIMFLS
jgi:hypothetical protein